MSYMRNVETAAFVGPIVDDSREYEFLKGLRFNFNGSIRPLYEDVGIQEIEGILGVTLDESAWQSFALVVEPLTLAQDLAEVLGVAKANGDLTSAVFFPNAAITGAATNSRTLSVADTTAGTVLATLPLVSGVDPVAGAAESLPLSVPAVSQGDSISYKSTHVGTGLVGGDPGGLVVVAFNEPTWPVPGTVDYSDSGPNE